MTFAIVTVLPEPVTPRSVMCRSPAARALCNPNVAVGWSPARSEAPAAIPTSNIGVAAREIPPKTQITAADLKLVKMNTEVVPPAALTSADQVVGKITINSISVGEPILPTKLGGANGQIFTVFPPAALGSDGAPPVNSPNYRAMSITV